MRPPEPANLGIILAELQRRVLELERNTRRSAVLNKRDLVDAQLWDVRDGQTDVYRKATGTWEPEYPLLGSLFDAKGDLIVGAANDSWTRLAAGANGRRLTADSAAATGMVWDPVLRASVKRSGAQSISAATWTTVTWTSTINDSGGFVSGSTLVAPRTGVYLCFVRLTWNGDEVASQKMVTIEASTGTPICDHDAAHYSECTIAAFHDFTANQNCSVKVWSNVASSVNSAEFGLLFLGSTA